tara:strand:- start:173 stop:1129 length:957 start_codon:yes stop_codon:yes gene_type:complete
MNKKVIPKIIKHSITHDWLHVFMVASPVLAILSRMVIDYYKLKKENILIVKMRDTSLEIFNHDFIEINPKKIDRYKEKLFFDSPAGREISNKIRKIDKNFLVYTGGAWKEVNWLLKDSLSKGHFYIEEGQASYRKMKTYDFKKINFWETLKSNLKNRKLPSDGIGFYFRNDFEGCIGMGKGAFPEIEESKKYILDNFNDVKCYYKPKIIGSITLGLTSSASRHPLKSDWEEMLLKLINNLPHGALIKPHPSFTCNKKVEIEFKEIFYRVNNKDIKLCGSDVMIEFEMIHEKKILFGPQSSLSIYAEMLGSKYNSISLF